MRVLIFGAGASICSGYPKAEELLDTLARDAEHSGSELKDARDRWTEVVANAPEEVQPLLTARNPEIVLSLLDLCEMFISKNFRKVFPGEKGREAAEQSLSRDRLDRELFSNLGHGRRDEARTMLVEIYNWFTEGFDTADLKDAKALLDELAG